MNAAVRAGPAYRKMTAPGTIDVDGRNLAKHQDVDSALHRVSFDFTPDDLADVAVRYVAGTARGRATRRNAIIAAGVAGAGGFLLVLLLISGERDATSVMQLTLVALPVGLITAYTQAQTYASSVRRRTERLLKEELGSKPMRCDVELRADGVWMRQQNIEILHAWKDLISIDDGADGVEMRFRGSYLLIRSRAFTSAQERATFFDAAHKLAHVPVT